jgi:hypothetical protein
MKTSPPAALTATELAQAVARRQPRMAPDNDLPNAAIAESGLKITPLDAAVPDTARR